MSEAPSLVSRIVHRIVIGRYRHSWRFEGKPPGVAKCVVTGAPDTSNWDFVFVLGAVEHLGLKPAARTVQMIGVGKPAWLVPR